MRYRPLTAAILASTTLSLSSLTNATSFDFTGHSGSNLGTSITQHSLDNTITATLTTNNNGISAFSLDGYGVSGDGYRSIQGNETLFIQFDQAVDVQTLHLRQWEGPDDATIRLTTWNGAENNISVINDNGGPFNTNEYVALNAIGITSIALTGIHNGEILGIPATQFFTAGLLGVEVSQVPIPASAWLFGSALFGLIRLKKLKK